MERSTRGRHAMQHGRLIGFIILAVVLLPQATLAGEYRVVRDHYSNSRTVPLVAYEGEITEGDAKKLRSIISRFCPTDEECEFDNTTAILSLNSGGGAFSEGILLAETLRELRVATVVENGSQCLSACALAFLGGSGFHATGGVGHYVDRFMEPDARIGFHSPFTQPLSGLSDNLKLDLTVRGLRVSIADLARFLLRYNVDPIVVDRIIMMDPDQFYDITTFSDLFYFRVDLPEFPVHLAEPAMEGWIYNVCSRLAALHYREEFDASADMIDEGFETKIAKTEAGIPLDGYNILDRPLNAAWCGLRNDPSPGYSDLSESFTISFARMVWRDDQSDTYADPVLSFNYTGDGWSSADYRGGTATRSILRLGPLNHWLYPTEARVASLGPEVRRYIEDDKRVTFAPFGRWSDSVLSARDFDELGPGTRLYDVEGLRVRVEARPASFFDHKLRRYNGLRNTRIAYHKSYDDAFFFEGLKADGYTGFLVVGLRDVDASLIITIEYPVGSDGKPSADHNPRINAIACSASFGPNRLPCS